MIQVDFAVMIPLQHKPASMTRTQRRLLLPLVIALSAAAGGARAQLGVPSGNLCSALNNCNGHGRCVSANKTCICFEGYGAASDVTSYKSPDCSQRACLLLTSGSCGIEVCGCV